MLWVDVRVSGQRVRRPAGKTLAAAERLRAEILAGKGSDSTGPTFEHLAEKYLAKLRITAEDLALLEDLEERIDLEEARKALTKEPRPPGVVKMHGSEGDDRWQDCEEYVIYKIMSRPVRRSSRTPSAPKGAKARPRVVTATAAVRRFADLVEDVRRTGRAWTVTHHGRAVCAIGPAPPGSATLAMLVEALSTGPQPDAGLAAAVRRAARSQPRVEPPRWGG